MFPPLKVKEERARLRGSAYGVTEDGQVPVDGIYDVSTILVHLGTVTHDRRRETVAFKVSGVGPDQLVEPYSVKTLEVSAP